MQTAIYKRPALGQKAPLGALYNARTDTFMPDSVFDTAPTEAIEVTDLNRAVTVFGTSDTYKEKFEKMAIGPELMATLLASSTNISGSGDYLNEQRESFPSVHRAMHYSLQTVEEKMNLFGSSTNQYIDKNRLNHQEPTHIVTEILWGANCVVSATRRISVDDNRASAQKSLADAFEVLEGEYHARPAPRQFSGELPARSEGHNRSLDVKIYVDLQVEDQIVATNLTEAKTHLTKLPGYIQGLNDGKGLQISYSLLPIAFISLMFGIPPTVTVGQPSLECLTRLIALLDDVNEACCDLNEYYAFLKRNAFCVPPDHLMEIGNQIRYAGLSNTNLLDKYSHSLKAIRQGTTGSQEIWQHIDDFDNGECSPKSLRSLAWTAKKKIDFVSAALSGGAKYIGYDGGSVEDFVDEHRRGTAYVLYISTQTMESDPSWDNNSKLFFQLLRQEKGPVAVADCDAIAKPITSAAIAHYENGTLLTEDFAEEESALAKKNRIYYDVANIQSMDDVPAQRQAVLVPCPGFKCDSSFRRHWVCFLCQCPVEYGTLDKYFYCACGRIRFDQTAFRCSDPYHGNDPDTFSGVDLYRMLESMPPPNELNVLILGETGVGKSTFINAFINYLTYDTLDEALKTPQLNWVIPCAFATQIPDPKTDGFIQKQILVGEDTDEHGALKGQSATQKATAYAIYVQDQLVRLIDTPGMGDTRGPEQDRQNMSDVLSVLRSYDNIHGIIMLLKPNESRLNFMFRFVVQELLGHLHRSAARNMVFAFTNTRGTNFAPGDSYVPLKKLLNEFKDVIPPLSRSNVYCFDSESFRYLAAKKQAGLDLGEIEDYRRSWGKSAAESQRLRHHFETLQPHPVKHTVSLNATRYLIESLVAPMRQISKTILGSIAESEKRKVELQMTTATGEDLKAKLKIPKTVVTAHQSDQPVTACNHIDCAKKVDKESQTREVSSANSGEVNKIRKSLCHNPCSLKEIAAYKPGAAGLAGCAAFYKNEGKCRTCKHGWQDHEHILVWYSEKTEINDDPEVVSLLAMTNNEAKAKSAALGALDNQIKEFNEEHRKIQEAAANFTVYMQKNSITVYNDATLAYLRHLIKEETNNYQLHGDDTRLEALKREEQQYQAYVDTISAARKRGIPGAVLDEVGVSKLVKELYSMKHYGEDLKKVANVVSKAYAATFRETAYHVRPKHYWMRAQGRPRPGRGKYPSMLDVGSLSVRMAPARHRSTLQKLSHINRKSLPGRPPQPVVIAEDDTAWQASYARFAPQKSQVTEQRAEKAFLPFDDEIVAEPSRASHNASQLDRKQGLDKLGLVGTAEDAPPPYSDPVAHMPKVSRLPKKRRSIFGVRNFMTSVKQKAFRK